MLILANSVTKVSLLEVCQGWRREGLGLVGAGFLRWERERKREKERERLYAVCKMTVCKNRY